MTHDKNIREKLNSRILIAPALNFRFILARCVHQGIVNAFGETKEQVEKTRLAHWAFHIAIKSESDIDQMYLR